jgi:hypothetical protein
MSAREPCYASHGRNILAALHLTHLSAFTLIHQSYYIFFVLNLGMPANSKEYQMDRTVFNAMTFKEADNHYSAWKDKPYSERLRAASFLINQFYKTSNQTAIDKSVFSKRKHS